MSTPSSQLTIEPFVFEDHSKLSVLHKQFYSVDRDETFWKWKYQDRPLPKYAIAVAKDSSGNIVGQTGAIAYACSIKGKSKYAGQAQDIVVLDEYRGGRSFFKLERLARDLLIESGGDISYGFSIEITRKVATKALGFTDIGLIPKMVQVYNPAPYLAHKIKIPGVANFIGALVRPILTLKNKRAPKADLGSEIKIEEVNSFDERFDELWNSEKDKYPLIMNRDAAYLNWRYTNNPAHQHFKAFAAVKGGILLGYIIVELKKGFRTFSTLNVQVNAAMRGEILDYLVREEEGIPSDKILERLTREAQDYLIKQKVEIISAWCLPHMKLFKLLNDIGYKERPTPHHLIVRKHSEDPDLETVFDLSCWYLTHGDKDHF